MEYTVSGLQGKTERNVLAFLGPAPQTNPERLNFLVSARSKVEHALQALGYYQPIIDLQTQRSEPVWQLEIAVNLGEPVRIRDISIVFLGSAANDEAFTELLGNTNLVSASVLDHGKFEAFRKRVLSLGQQRGYLDAEILQSRVAVRADAGTADIEFTYDSGKRYRFGEVVQNEALLNRELLDALKPFQQGDFFDQVRLREYQNNLQRTGYFSSVIVQPLRLLARQDEVPIEVKLHAANSHSFDVGIGYSTDTEERVSLTWRTPRINRYGHSQVTRLQYSPVNPSGRFTYSIPIYDPLNDVVQLWASTEENEYGDLDSQQDELGIRREIRNGQWIYGYSLRDLNESWEVLGINSNDEYLLLGGSLSGRVQSGSLVDPASGFSQLYTLEAGNEQLGSVVDLLRLTAEFRAVFTPWPRQRFVSRAEFGVVEIANGDRFELAPSLNFFAGGSQSIRGYAYQSLGNEIVVDEGNGRTKTLVVGGDRLVTGSLEYQYYFTDVWRGALFVDGGDAFDEGEFDANYGVGFGVHYITPVGAVRVELANSVSDENPDWYLHLSIGAEF
ncbi:MAG: autotransporter assembly complex protein TamA [Halioglobus sp.]|nr:autotransporter assembly complex protein TamA [Halioglobus sp.]